MHNLFRAQRIDSNTIEIVVAGESSNVLHRPVYPIPAICSILKCERMHASICRLRVISPTRTTIHIPVTALMTREEVIAEHADWRACPLTERAVRLGTVFAKSMTDGDGRKLGLY